MAGHSKWANIQHRKKAQDAKRGKVFTRLIREITVASRMGGSDPNANPRLRLGMDKALAANMPKDTIERAIKKGAGELDGASYEEIRYEGYGPGGVAVMVDCMTDNRNRTVSEVRHAFTKCGGNLGTSGSVAFQFTETGILSYPPGSDEDAIMEAALEAGADDVISSDDDSVEVLTQPANFQTVLEAMKAAGLEPDNAEVTMRADVLAPLGVDDAQKVLKLMDMLEELDDTQNVYSNADFPDELLNEL
ncbi:MAG: YebC/PmpR family DNA-binding transcriptional regulator [Candidatus Competibacteraceae bacterium]|nr:YebC/PmpR family DNA-binding transcriptional regulator [Candidatus Competibacteraceae bacterium]MCB1813521.1 YebC/PmpR family DNA-binding transcriptional regulator [Candidatus Competibacteraceae bacterium]